MKKLLFVGLMALVLLISTGCELTPNPVEKTYLEGTVMTYEETQSLPDFNTIEGIIEGARDIITYTKDSIYRIDNSTKDTTLLHKNSGVTVSGSVDQPEPIFNICTGQLNTSASGGSGLLAFRLGVVTYPLQLWSFDGEFPNLYPGYYYWAVLEFETAISLSNPYTLHIYPDFEIYDLCGCLSNNLYKHYTVDMGMTGNLPAVFNFGSNTPTKP